ncbi:MAG: hypothetical protein QOE70_1350 [Chthoniobacter sp.]|jgi:hypothetical protein|nr:hypothetical protein [Chthoniobacter sp.]
MLNAKKLTAVILRLFAFGMVVYIFLVVISSALIFGGLPLRFVGLVALACLAAALLFIYAIPLAGVISNDIDQS